MHFGVESAEAYLGLGEIFRGLDIRNYFDS